MRRSGCGGRGIGRSVGRRRGISSRGIGGPEGRGGAAERSLPAVVVAAVAAHVTDVAALTTDPETTHQRSRPPSIPPLRRRRRLRRPQRPLEYLPSLPSDFLRIFAIPTRPWDPFARQTQGSLARVVLGATLCGPAFSGFLRLSGAACWTWFSPLSGATWTCLDRLLDYLDYYWTL